MTPDDVGRFTGQFVLLRWRDPENDWPAFQVIHVHGWEVWLRGVADTDGTPHDGSSVVVLCDEIASMEPYPDMRAVSAERSQS